MKAIFTPMRGSESIVILDGSAGGFSVRACPDSDELAAFIRVACNSHEQLVDAVRQQHKALDTLMARLIQLDPEFMPTKSGLWSALQAGNAALAAAGAA